MPASAYDVKSMYFEILSSTFRILSKSTNIFVLLLNSERKHSIAEYEHQST